jgi:uncharacterized membrane protein YjfL (UPF0719 family)
MHISNLLSSVKILADELPAQSISLFVTFGILFTIGVVAVFYMITTKNNIPLCRLAQIYSLILCSGSLITLMVMLGYNLINNVWIGVIIGMGIVIGLIGVVLSTVKLVPGNSNNNPPAVK